MIKRPGVMMSRYSFAVFFTLCGLLSQTDAHPFHVSVGEMQYDAQAQRLEIAVRVWPVDLERSIKRKLNLDVDLDSNDVVVKQAADKTIATYFRSAFSAMNREKEALEIEWVGREAEGSHVWIYLQIPIDDEKKLNDLSLTNRICFESLHDQVNTIRIKSGDEQLLLQFTRDEPTAVLKTGARQ